MENPIKMDDFFNGASIWMVKSWSLIYYMPVGSARLCGGSSAGAEDVQDGQMFNNNRFPLLIFDTTEYSEYPPLYIHHYPPKYLILIHIFGIIRYINGKPPS